MMTYNRTMISLNINEIKTHFSSFLAKVSNGETVIVCKRNVPIAEIKPIAVLPNKKRPIGLAGKEYPDFKINDAFLTLSRMILLLLLMAKTREVFTRHLHFSLVD
jgi:antitoxin (DNA-binding transcriptional repressor) of toxin-antitoxin stability system